MAVRRNGLRLQTSEGVCQFGSSIVQCGFMNSKNILNNSMTSSFDTNVNISGWICRSMYKRRSGKIFIGPGLKYRSFANPIFCPSAASSPSVRGWVTAGIKPVMWSSSVNWPSFSRRCAKLVSASSPSGLRVLSGRESSLGLAGGRTREPIDPEEDDAPVRVAASGCVDGGRAVKPGVPLVCKSLPLRVPMGGSIEVSGVCMVEGDGDIRFAVSLANPGDSWSGDGEREPPSAAACRAGFPSERRTMSSVFSILFSDRWRASDFFVERFPRLLSSKTHSWPPVSHRLHGGPFSAPTHFILSLRQTVQALDPLVCLIFAWELDAPPASTSPSS